MNDTNLSSFRALRTLKGLKFVHINCCSIVSKINEIRQILVPESEVDVLCITESWLKPYHDSDLFAIPNYTLYRLDRTRKSVSGEYTHGGGVVCYVRMSITSNYMDIIHSTIDLEIMVISVRLKDQRTIFLCTAYRPPSGNYQVAFNLLSDIVCKLRCNKLRHSIIIGGDLNIDLSKPKSTPAVQAYNNFCREFSLSSVISSPTRYSLLGSSIIDVFLTDSSIVASHGVININISDHLAIYICLKKSKETYTSTCFRGRSYLNYNKHLFQQRLFFTNWGKFFAMQDVTCAWDFFYETILRKSDAMCPIKEFKIRKDHPPWFKSELIELSANRDHLYSVGRRTRNNVLIKEANSLKNLIKHSLVNAKKSFYLAELNRNKNDSKKFWINMHNLLSEGSKANIDKIYDPESDRLVDGIDAADLLNEYYVTIADKLVKKSDDASFDGMHIVTESKLKFSCPVSERLLKSIIKELDPTKSSGCLRVSSKLYIDAFEILTEQLLHLYNLSLLTQTFPDAWKKSVVIPLPKKGDRFLMSNTRPISLIHICGKILEKVVNSLVHTYTLNSNIISDKQYGFTKNKSTTNCINALSSDLFHSINDNKLTCCLFLDYSKAFDSVSHDLLIKKLARYGFEDLGWFISYLSNRLQCVRVGNAISSFRPITRGVPQGSVLGPTLFNLFLNDITMLNLDSKLLLYADDVVLYFTGENLTSITNILQADLDKIQQWSINNGLAINASKTKALLVGGRHKIQNNSDGRKEFMIDQKPLEWVNCFSYLGLLIDETLSFNPAIEQMHRKAAYKLRTMYLIRNNLTTFGSLTMAKSMVIPYLDYGVLFMSSCHESLIKRLQYLQNRVLKCALKLGRMTGTKCMHSLARVLMVKDRIYLNQLAIIHHGILTNSSLFPICNTLNPRTRTSNEIQISLTRPNVELFRRSLYYNGIKSWNALPLDLRNCTTLSTFKNRLKTLLLNSYTTLT